MMKKLFAVILAAALLICSVTAVAEAAKPEIKCDIVDGSYVIRIPDESGDLGWRADDMAQDDFVVKLAKSGLEDKEFVVQYDPTGDGEVTVGVRHYYNSIACDEYHTWDLSVKDGKVTEVTGGTYTASPAPETIDAALLGEYLSADGMSMMEITKNESGQAWDVKIDGATSHDGYEFVATIYFDCEMNHFVYDKGKTWVLPITDSEEEPELGEPNAFGLVGTFYPVGNPEDMILTWMREEDAGNTMNFQRIDAPVGVNFGTSQLFLEEDLNAAMNLIREELATWEGVELHAIRYAGDENSTEENLKWLNEHEFASGKKYTECALFKTDFHSPAEGGELVLDPDTEYEDYQWWLARVDGGNWEIVDAGY